MARGTAERQPSGMPTRLEFLTLVFGLRCFYCKQEFPIEELTRDHVVPKFLDGSDALENQVPACRACNQRKGCRPPTEDELAEVRRVWESRLTKRIKKKVAPPCYTCNGNVAELHVPMCVECGRISDGRHIILATA